MASTMDGKLPILTPAIVASAASSPPLQEWLISQSTAMIALHQQQLSYWTAVKSQLTGGSGGSPTAYNSAAVAPAESSTPKNPKMAFMEGLASKIGAGPLARARSTSVQAEEDAFSGSEPERSPTSLTHASRPRMKKNSRSNKTTQQFQSPRKSPTDDSNAKSSADTIAGSEPAFGEAGSSERARGISDEKPAVPPPVPAGFRSASGSPVSSTPPSPSSAAMAAANRRPPPLPPSAGNSKPSSRSSSRERALPAQRQNSTPSVTERPSAEVPGLQPQRSLPQLPRTASNSVSSAAPPVAEASAGPGSDEDYLGNAQPSAAAAPAQPRFGGVKLPTPAVGGANNELMAKLQKKREAAGSGPGAGGEVLTPSKSATAAPAARVPPIAAVSECSTCSCGDFKQDPFKKNKCANCFHVH